MTQPAKNKPDARRTISETFMTVVAMAMIAYHALIVWRPMFNDHINQNVHLGFCLVLYLMYASRQPSQSPFRWLYRGAVVLCLGLVTYVGFNYERLTMWAGFPEPPDIGVGVLLILTVLGLVWKQWGAVFPLLTIGGILYALFGHLAPGFMSHPPFEFGYIVSSLSVGMQGIYGMMLSMSVNIIFMLIIFGATFEIVGINRLFIEIGNIISRYVVGGAGQTAIFSSSFVGMVNGAAVANVAITGAYTIPMMKKSGFRPSAAAAIEAVASTGGQLTPPIMGIAIFLMASFLGVSFPELMAKALIPALSYYAVAAGGVYLIARREGIASSTTPVDKKYIILGAPLFIIPMGLLTIMLFRHFSPGYAALLCTLVIMAIAFVRKGTRPGIKSIVKGLTRGAVMGANLGLAIACIGMFIKLMTFTGLSTKLVMAVTALGGGYVIGILIMTMILSIFLSCAMPTPVAYVMVALVVVPVLKDFGLPLHQAHFFVFYFAVLAAVTPPVAGATMVASELAGAGYMKSGWEGLKLIAPFFLMPYFMIFNPVVLSESQPLLSAIMILITMMASLCSMTCSLQGYFLYELSPWERLAFFAVAVLGIVFGISHVNLYFFATMILFFGLLIRQINQRKKIVMKRVSRINISSQLDRFADTDKI